MRNYKDKCKCFCHKHLIIKNNKEVDYCDICAWNHTKKPIKKIKHKIDCDFLKDDGSKCNCQEKPHRHKWIEHCDCSYCELEECVKCGEERERIS